MCECRKRKPVVEPIPEPTQLPKALTEEEIDWFNNIDVIEPIKPKENE
jgi:hypothetical protein